LPLNFRESKEKAISNGNNVCAGFGGVGGMGAKRIYRDHILNEEVGVSMSTGI